MTYPAPGFHIPEGTKLEVLIELLRERDRQLARNLSTLKADILKDARRVNGTALGLSAMEGAVSLDTATLPTAGQVLYAIDPLHAAWGDAANPAPGSGGVTPLVNLPNALLDGVSHSDTVAQAVSKGSLVVGNSTPKWDELVAGTNTYMLVADSAQTLGLKYVNPNNLLLDGDHHTDTDASTVPVNGDVIIRAGGIWTVLSAGAADRFFKSNGSAPSWQASIAKTGAAKVDATGQAAAIGATTLVSAAGMYQVDYYLVDTTADGTAGTIQFQVNYTDDAGATTQVSAALVLTALGRTSGSFQVYLTSGNLQYQTNLVGIIGTSRYALFVRVLNLG